MSTVITILIIITNIAGFVTGFHLKQPFFSSVAIGTMLFFPLIILYSTFNVQDKQYETQKYPLGLLTGVLSFTLFTFIDKLFFGVLMSDMCEIQVQGNRQNRYQESFNKYGGIIGTVLVNNFYFVHYGVQFKGIGTILMLMASFLINAAISVFVSSSYLKKSSYSLLDSDSGEEEMQEDQENSHIKMGITFVILEILGIITYVCCPKVTFTLLVLWILGTTMHIYQSVKFIPLIIKSRREEVRKNALYGFVVAYLGATLFGCLQH